jgi:hypothetical protein
MRRFALAYLGAALCLTWAVLVILRRHPPVELDDDGWACGV